MRVPAPDSTRPASADLTSLRSSVADITKFMRSYFRCGGIAVGDPAAVDDCAGRAACEYRINEFYKKIFAAVYWRCE